MKSIDLWKKSIPNECAEFEKLEENQIDSFENVA